MKSILLLSLMLSGMIETSPVDSFKEKMTEICPCLTSRMEFCMLVSLKTPQLRRKRFKQFIHQLWMESYPKNMLKQIEQAAEETGFYAK